MIRLNLSDDILRSFTSSLKQDRPSADVTMFGVVKQIVSPQEVAVLLDGSSEYTIARIAATCQVDDRVSVLIKDHKAVVTGNLTNPASASSDSSYIRILPDGSIVIGRLDDHGNPVGFYVQATNEDYEIKHVVDGNPTTILTVGSDGIEINGSGTINGNNFDYEAGTNIQFTPNPETGKVTISATSQSVLNYVYPVGSIYMSVNSTSPATLFGGVWTKIKDRFLLAAGDSYSAGNTGGEARHTLTVNEMPSHSHKVSSGYESSYDHPDRLFYARLDGRYQSSAYGSTQFIENTGGGEAHNNMPPYLVVHMWRRTS